MQLLFKYIIRILYKCQSRICFHRYRKLLVKLGVFREENENETVVYIVSLVPLGSVAELPAESCAEIRAGEGEDARSGN